MNNSHLGPATGRTDRSIRGSFLAALAGWAAVMVVKISSDLIYYFCADRDYRDSMWFVSLGFYAVFGIVAGVFVFGTWLVLLLPLYCRIPLNSMLWRWPWCTTCGAIAGAAIMIVWCKVTSPQATDGWGLAILAAIAGGAVCLFASLTRDRFRA